VEKTGKYRPLARREGETPSRHLVKVSIHNEVKVATVSAGRMPHSQLLRVLEDHKVTEGAGRPQGA